MKKILITGASAGGILLAAAVVFLSLYDFAQWQQPIATHLSNAVGREVQVVGPIHIRKSLAPTLVIEGVGIANRPWAKEDHIAHVARVEIRPSFLAALVGSLVIKELVFDGVNINIETDGDGGANWHRDVAPGDLGSSPAVAPNDYIPVRKLSVRNMVLRYRSGWAQMEENYDIQAIDIAATGLASPIEVSMNAVHKGNVVNVAGTVGQLSSFANNAPAAVRLAGNYGSAQMTLTGDIAEGRTLDGMDLDFELNAESLNEYAAIQVTTTTSYELPQNQRVKVTARAISDEQGPRLIDLVVRIGGVVLRL